MRRLFDQFCRELRAPMGIEVEWATGGFRFMPPGWTRIVLGALVGALLGLVIA